MEGDEPRDPRDESREESPDEGIQVQMAEPARAAMSAVTIPSLSPKNFVIA